jgi:glutaminyl-tRNA synthetase
MVVFDPLKVIITNFPANKTEVCYSENNPEDPESGLRKMPFSREIYIEREDFMEVAPKKFFRLAPGQMVRLKSAYIIRCDDFVKNEAGEIVELYCSYIENSKSGNDTSGASAKGVLHWVSVKEALKVEIRQYDRLFKVSDLSAEDGDFKEYLNPDSLQITTAFAEPALTTDDTAAKFQFIRKGYFCMDSDTTTDKLVFNRTVGLKDTWAKAHG